VNKTETRPKLRPHLTTLVKALGPVRVSVGVARLSLPGTEFPGLASTPLPSRVGQLLGARQIVQAVAMSGNPPPAVLWLGTEVDALHAASMIGLACIDRRYRRAALVDATIAAVFALLGTVAACLAPPEALAESPLIRWRNREALRAARLLVPWCPHPTSYGVAPRCG
jgi:hypothetical protein